MIEVRTAITASLHNLQHMPSERIFSNGDLERLDLPVLAEVGGRIRLEDRHLPAHLRGVPQRIEDAINAGKELIHIEVPGDFTGKVNDEALAQQADIAQLILRGIGNDPDLKGKVTIVCADDRLSLETGVKVHRDFLLKMTAQEESRAAQASGNTIIWVDTPVTRSFDTAKKDKRGNDGISYKHGLTKVQRAIHRDHREKIVIDPTSPNLYATWAHHRDGASIDEIERMVLEAVKAPIDADGLLAARAKNPLRALTEPYQVKPKQRAAMEQLYRCMQGLVYAPGGFLLHSEDFATGKTTQLTFLAQLAIHMGFHAGYQGISREYPSASMEKLHEKLVLRGNTMGGALTDSHLYKDNFTFVDQAEFLAGAKSHLHNLCNAKHREARLCMTSNRSPAEIERAMIPVSHYERNHDSLAHLVRDRVFSTNKVDHTITTYSDYTGIIQCIELDHPWQIE